MKNPVRSAGEEWLALHLKAHGYEFVREFQFHPTRKWRADFYLPAHEVLIEVDGVNYHSKGRHQTATGFEADCEKLNEAAALGYIVLRFTPNQIKGTARRNNKSRDLMERAIDVIDRVCFPDEH